MTSVLDASAVLAFLLGEDGAEIVEGALADDPRCGAANWSEVARRVMSTGRDWHLAQALLARYAMRVEPVVRKDAEWAARRWRQGEGLSLADRLCLALAERLDAKVFTADKSWGQSGRIVQIR
ncbi:MAG: type II toxin-antitoxin system VapC family toxin [Acidimicrobiaceae bacterium]|nr:type II toxin-antitoxin system VapC family toxin [Acidimicrobiaceae bacterium]MYE75151.1 type II toxin-antitoxin system VapC family toxin [Acidimicrobiaceae bacterium]MYE96887.1 type II toxin-antitoxin system VapC family toxin [Acidimicrobiaceae bacterium]MYI52414.1 type II toxin-antitoxin system VapC family toxin [Acidimicrobiaceae bacterium]